MLDDLISAFVSKCREL